MNTKWNWIVPFLFACIGLTTAQAQSTNEQWRIDSNKRTFYVWDYKSNQYQSRDHEDEHTVIEVRMISSAQNGYVVIALTDNGVSRMFHGSITQFTENEKERSWSLQSKNLQSNLTFDKQTKDWIYKYEVEDNRYKKIFIFKESQAI